MNQKTVLNLLQKIKSICKECQFQSFPEKITSLDQHTTLDTYQIFLQKIKQEIIRYRLIQQDYAKLQLSLQRQEIQLRKKVSIELQFTLVLQNLKAEVHSLEQQKQQMLQNTVKYIKELKKTNEILYIKLAEQRKQSFRRQKIENKRKSASPSKRKGEKSINQSKHNTQAKGKMEVNIHKLTKTQFIERKRQDLPAKAVKMISFQNNSDVSQSQVDIANIRQNTRACQIPENTSRKKYKNVNQKHKRDHQFSSITMFNFFDSNQKKAKKQGKPVHLRKIKSPLISSKKRMMTNFESTYKNINRAKKLNKSIYSMVSCEQNSVSQKNIG